MASELQGEWLEMGAVAGPGVDGDGVVLESGPSEADGAWGRVSVSGADFLRGRSLGTERKSGASVQSGVEGALAGPVGAREDRAVSPMEMDGGMIPIFWLVAAWMVRSNSLTSSIVMSEGREKDAVRERGNKRQRERDRKRKKDD